MYSDARSSSKPSARDKLLRLLWKENGAATVFSILVLSSLMLFFGLLIDYARIAAAHKRVEDAARSSVRSVLSAYDDGLYARYGLFGRGGTDGSKLLEETMKLNLETTPYTAVAAMNMVRISLNETELFTAGVLGDHALFSRQVLEDMKYKAPVDFTIELIGKFAPLAKTLKTSISTVDVLEQLRKLYERREAELEAVLGLQRSAATAVELQREAEAAAEWIRLYDQYRGWVEHDAGLDEGAQPKYEEEIKLYQQEAGRVLSQLNSALVEQDKAHAARMKSAREKLKNVVSYNQEMKAAMAAAEQQDDNDGFDAAAASEYAGNGSSGQLAGSVTALNEIGQSAAAIIRSDEWFDEYEAELNEQERRFERIASSGAGLQSSIAASLSASFVSSEGLSEASSRLEQDIEGYQRAYVNPGAILNAREKELEDGDVKAKLKEQQREMDAEWRKVSSMLSSLSSLEAIDEHKEQYAQVQQRYERNLQYNLAAAEAEELNDGHVYGKAHNTHDAANESSAALKGVFNGFAGMLERARDDLYYGEYVLNRYQSFPPQKLRGLLENGNMDELSDMLAFSNQEAEYVLYGFHSPASNLAAAYSELFAVRLAIRTMEGLVESKHLGHPLLILSGALIYGLKHTIEDLLAFTKRGAAPLSKYAPVDVSYKDYLRIFMLLHGGGEQKRLSRMIAVIEHNRSLTLAEVPAGVTGEVSASIKLWFIPGIIKIIGRAGLLAGKVDGGRYELHETIGSSY